MPRRWAVGQGLFQSASKQPVLVIVLPQACTDELVIFWEGDASEVLPGSPRELRAHESMRMDMKFNKTSGILERRKHER